MRRLAALLALVLASSLAPSAQTVRDSVKMSLSVYTWYTAGEVYITCGAGVIATWPNVLQDLLGSETRTYGYHDYGRVATEDMYIPRGYGEDPDRAPEGFVAHNPQLASWGSSPGRSPDCGRYHAAAAYRAAGGTGPLNGAPFRVTEWYATFSLPSGTPIALFEWAPADGLAIDFDASFESGQSREVDADAPGGKRPVASYAWSFGDGASGSGARPRHTYDGPGEYTVRLVVTDDDGEQASREQTVTVRANHLTVRIEAATEEAVEGDTLDVRATVTNSGSETVFGVRASRDFTRVARVPDELYHPSGQLWGLGLSPLEVADDEDETVYRASLAPGESFEVERRYVVTSAATFRIFRETDFAPADVFVDWTGLARVEGETPEEDQVEVRQPCTETDARCATTLVTYPTYEVALVSASGPRARTGLPPGPSVDDVRFVRYEATEAGEVPVCESGCVDVVVRVRDEDGEPAADLDVDVWAHASGTPLADVRGGFFCERVPLGRSGDCAALDATLRVRTDDAGEARVWVALQAAAPTATERELFLQAEVVEGDDASRADHRMPIDETVVHEQAFLIIGETSATWAGIVHTTLAASSYISIGEWCEWGLKWIRDQSFDAADLSRYQKNMLLTYGGSQIVPWACSTAVEVFGAAHPAGAVLESIDSVVDPARKALDILQYTWFAQEMSIDKGSDLIGLSGPNPPPLVFWFQGDVLDVANEVSGFATDGGFAGGDHEILIQEATGLFQPSGRTSADDFDPERYGGDLRIRYHSPHGTHEALLTNGYVPVVTSAATIGSDGFLVDNRNAAGRAASRLALRGATAEPAAAGDPAARVEGWGGEPGEFVVIGEGTATPEVLQVATVDAPETGPATLTFTTPLRYAHGAGEEVERIVAGELAPPAPPVLQPHRRAGPPTRLAWASMPTDLAAAYDLQVATDTTAASLTLALEETGLRADSLQVDPALFAEGTEYAWRVRAASRLGEGAWSPWQTFTPSAPVSAEEGAPALPTALVVGAPFPNPARGVATLPVALPEAQAVRVTVFDALGRAVATVHDGPLPAGRHALALEVGRWPSGVYVARLEAGEDVRVQRLTVVR